MGERLLSPLAFYSARPTLQVDGQAHEAVALLLQSLVMHEQEGGLSQVELTFVDWGLRPDGGVGPVFDDERVLRLGAAVRILAGDVAAQTELFQGRISALEHVFDTEGPPRLVVLAEDATMRARLARRSEVYTNQSLADIVRTLAQRLVLAPQVSGLADTLPIEVQCNESDLAFLRRLLARQGADLQVVGDRLEVSPWQDVQRGTVALVQGSQLHRLRVAADLTDQVTEVEVTGFDALAGRGITGLCRDTAFGPGRGRNGPGLLREAFGERRQHSAHRLACTQAEADALARAEMERRTRRFVRVEGTCEGNPALRVGTHLDLQGAGPRWSNRYCVTGCTHRYDMRAGYETQFQAEGAFLGSPA